MVPPLLVVDTIEDDGEGRILHPGGVS